MSTGTPGTTKLRALRQLKFTNPPKPIPDGIIAIGDEFEAPEADAKRMIDCGEAEAVGGFMRGTQPLTKAEKAEAKAAHDDEHGLADPKPAGKK